MLTLEQYKQAEIESALLEGQRGFRIHAVVYALVNAGLIALNVVLITATGSDFPWFVFPLVGWGIGLTFHYLAAFRWGDEQVRRHQEDVERYAVTHDRAA